MEIKLVILGKILDISTSRKGELEPRLQKKFWWRFHTFVKIIKYTKKKLITTDTDTYLLHTCDL